MSKLTHHNSVLTGRYHAAPAFQLIAEDTRHESRNVSGSCWPIADERVLKSGMYYSTLNQLNHAFAIILYIE
jgi:hypothetical protein